MKKTLLSKFYIKKLLLGVFLLFLFFGGISALWVLTIKIPDFNSLLERKIIQSTKIYDRTGTILLYDIHKDAKRTVISFDEIPRFVKNATIAIEDDRFYSHPGVDIWGILQGVIIDPLRGKRARGGSTITQQLVKNTFLTPERTITRKFKELVLALKVERLYNKDKILELYLNEIPYGSSAFGIQAAAQTFFNKSASDLTLAESAYLAALPNAPTYYSPYGKQRNELNERKDLVLKRMLDLGFIIEEEYNNAKKEKVVFADRADNINLKAPHFVMMVKDYLINRYGEDAVTMGGLKVTTTLDWELQKKAEEITKTYALENIKKFNATNAAMIGINPKTGDVLVLVGSRDYFDKEIDGNYNVTTALRQPGSAFKPFAYAAAFQKGFTPETTLFDLQTEFNSSCDPDIANQRPEDAEIKKCYHPENYDGNYRGPVTMREAIAQSLNVPSVKTLYLAGIKETIKLAEDLGINTLKDTERFGLTLVLGGGEVKPLEITSAYSVFANDGIKNDPVIVLKVADAAGNTLEEYKPNPKPVLNAQIARLINNVLSDNKARAPAFGEASALYFPETPVAVKTGTTNEYRDAWIIGYTPSFALGAWAGNNDNSQMEKKVAGFIIAPMWHAFFAEALKKLPPEKFTDPEAQPASKPVLRGEWRGGQSYFIDSISAKLATELTPPEFVKERVLTNVHSILYWLNKNDPLGPAPINPSDDYQFTMWEYPIRRWAAAQGYNDETNIIIPQGFDDIHRPEYAPKIFLIQPINQVVGNNLNIKTEITGRFNIKQVDFFLDDKFLGTKKYPPYEIFFDLKQLPDVIEKGTIKINAYDDVGNKGTAEYLIDFLK
jgi:1A family penicillin-binding protein